MKRDKTEIIIIHSSATEAGKYFDEKDIRQWHLGRGYRDIGYHFVILLDGRIKKGRDIDEEGSHAKGSNSNSIGVCYIGGVKSGKAFDTRTAEQKQAIQDLIEIMKRKYPTIKRVIGHRDTPNASTECPSFDVAKEFV